MLRKRPRRGHHHSDRAAEQPDAQNYFLNTPQARDIMDAVAAPNLKLMFDCYHVQIMEGDLSRKLKGLMPLIGHIQIAAVPDRRNLTMARLTTVTFSPCCGISAMIGPSVRNTGPRRQQRRGLAG